MNPTPLASVVIRSKDEAASIGRLLDILEAQTIADRLELIVVDSGSSDETVRIARDHGIDPIEIPAASFTFGGALNTGCEAAAEEVVVALSAHAYAEDTGWLERMIGVFEDERVDGHFRRRLRLVPGMTGPWQILGPTRVPLTEMVGIDYLYGANWSLWLDVKILVRTVGHVLSRRGV